MTKLFVFLLTSCAFAEQAKPVETLESIKAELALAQAQLIQVRLEFQYQMQVCQVPDLMMSRIATIQAQQEADKTKKSSKEDKK